MKRNNSFIITVVFVEMDTVDPRSSLFMQITESRNDSS